MKIPWVHHCWVDGDMKLRTGLNWNWDEKSRPELILHLPRIRKRVYFRIKTKVAMEWETWSTRRVVLCVDSLEKS